MKKMTKWLAVCAVCVMGSVPAMAAEVPDVTVTPIPIETPAPDVTPIETPAPTPIPEVKNGWYEYGTKNKKYFKDGQYLTGMRKIHGEVYYFSPKGFMKTGWIKYNNKKYYFGSNGIRYSGVKKISGKYYYFSDKGVLRTKTVKVGNTIYYCTEKGILEAWKKGKTIYYPNGKKMNSTKAYEYETLQRAKDVVSKITKPSMSKSEKFETCFRWVMYQHYYDTRRIFYNQSSDDEQTLNHILHIGRYAGKGHDIVDDSEEDDTDEGTPRGSESSGKACTADDNRSDDVHFPAASEGVGTGHNLCRHHDSGEGGAELNDHHNDDADSADVDTRKTGRLGVSADGIYRTAEFGLSQNYQRYDKEQSKEHCGDGQETEEGSRAEPFIPLGKSGHGIGSEQRRHTVEHVDHTEGNDEGRHIEVGHKQSAYKTDKGTCNERSADGDDTGKHAVYTRRKRRL